MKINETQLRKIVQENVKKVLKKEINPFYDYDENNYPEYEEIIKRLNSSYLKYRKAINDLQLWYLKNIEHSDDMHNSDAEKYGEEAKDLLHQSYRRLGNMPYIC